MIPEETRRESYEKVQIDTCSRRVYQCVLESGPVGAWAISGRLGWDCYVVRPRLTELHKAGKIKAVGKAWCEKTQRYEATWDVTDKQGELL